MARTKVSELYASTIDVQSRSIDWSEQYESWQAWSAIPCSRCGRYTVCDGTGEFECQRCGASVTFEGPMMNYFYAIPTFDRTPEEAAERIKSYNTCLVHLGDEMIGDEYDDDAWGLALTGGGMDLTWDIAGSYVALGYLPPLAYTRLPEYAGMRLTADKRRVIAACMETCREMERRGQSGRRSLRELRQRLAQATP